MRRRHFEALRPICPACLLAQTTEAPLELSQVVREADDVVLEGFLRCGACGSVFPILDGIPILVADIRRMVQGHIQAIGARRDFSGPMADFLGSCCGPGSSFETTRYHLSIYARDHYGDFDPEDEEEPAPLSAVRLLDIGLQALSQVPEGPAIDVGCSVGRTSFELAERLDRPVLGVDLSFPMLQLAQDVLIKAELRYPRRTEGTLYDERIFETPLPRREQVDFWLCDATNLPLPSATFAAGSHLNVLDCVPSPIDALRSFERILRPGARALLATPYDWSPGATPIEGWIGGHSQRSPAAGHSEPMLRSLLGGQHPAALQGLKLLAEPLLAEPAKSSWNLRLDARHAASYSSHLVTLARR